MDKMPQPGDFRGEPVERYWTAVAEWYRQRAAAAESKLDESLAGHREAVAQLYEVMEQKREIESRLDTLQAAVRSYLNATELDENTPAWYLLSGALANSSFVVERQNP
jgi:hypothetical protein